MYDVCLQQCGLFANNTLGHRDGARSKMAFRLLTDYSQGRLRQDLQQMVIKELAAPYTVNCLPDTGQITLTPELPFISMCPPLLWLFDELTPQKFWCQQHDGEQSCRMYPVLITKYHNIFHKLRV